MLIEACPNGALQPGALHLHPKDASGADSLRPADVASVLAAVRAAVPGVPVGVTTGAWTLPDPDERVAAVRAWTELPDFASVNWHEDGVDDVVGALLDRGVQVEAGLWHLAGVAAWQGSPHRDRCLRVLLELPDGREEAGAEAEAERLLAAVGKGPPVLLHGEGGSCWPALGLALRRGLDTRIGLEDVRHLPDGSPAPDNAALVRAATAVLSAVRAADRADG